MNTSALIDLWAGIITSLLSSSIMFSNTSNVEEGFHSSSMSLNTTTATGGEALSSTMSWWQQMHNKFFVSVTVMTLSIALSVGIIVSSRGNKVAQQTDPLEASGVTEFSTAILVA